MTCAACGGPLVLPPIGSVVPGGLMICPHCMRTIVVASGALATAEQTLVLSPAQVSKLKDQRKAARKQRGAA